MMIKFQRRQRTTFGKEQLEALQEAFKQTHYPEAHFREQLARTTKLDPSRIQVWFQNQRAKDRKRRGLLGACDTPPANKYMRNDDHHQHNQIHHYNNNNQQYQLTNHQYLNSNEADLQQVVGQVCSTTNNNPLLKYSSIESMIQEPSYNIDRGYRNKDMFRSSLVNNNSNNNENSIRKKSNYDVCIFNSVTANEAASAVKEGRFDNIVQYHRSKYSAKALETYYNQQKAFDNDDDDNNNNNINNDSSLDQCSDSISF